MEEGRRQHDRTLAGGQVHPTLAGQHAFVAVPPGAHTIAAAFAAHCAGSLAETDAAAANAVAPPPAKTGLPSAPPFAPAGAPPLTTACTPLSGGSPLRP